MNKKKFFTVASLGLMAGVISCSAIAEPTSGYTAQINLQVPLICKAVVLSPLNKMNSGESTLRIHELCNGSEAYQLKLLFSGQSELDVFYDGKRLKLSNKEGESSVLTSRRGAYHKKHELLILNAGEGLKIAGVALETDSGSFGQNHVSGFSGGSYLRSFVGGVMLTRLKL